MKIKTIDDHYDELESTFNWKEYYMALYHSIKALDDRMEKLEKDTEQQLKDYFKRVTWINAILITIFLGVMGFLLNENSINSKEVVRVDTELKMQSHTIILQKEYIDLVTEKLQDNINELWRVSPYKDRGAKKDSL